MMATHGIKAVTWRQPKLLSYLYGIIIMSAALSASTKYEKVAISTLQRRAISDEAGASVYLAIAAY